MAFNVLFALLALSTGLTVSPTTSPSPTPCSASPGYFCSVGSALICPIGAYCAGGAALNVSCYPVTACAVTGLSAQPPCYWNVSTVAGKNTAGYIDGQGGASAFTYPAGIASSASGIVYVADSSGHRIRAVTSSGLVSTLAGSGTALWADGTGTLASFNSPWDVAIYASTIYVADATNGRIRMITGSGVTSTFAGSGALTWADGLGTSASFNLPFSLTLDSMGVMYVADGQNNRIRRVSPLGMVSTLAGTGVASFSNGLGTSTASFNRPTGVAVDVSGNVYVGDGNNYRIRLILPNGTVSTFAGNGISAWTDGLRTSSSFLGTERMTLSATGNLFVADRVANRIRMVSSLMVTTITGGFSSSFMDGFGTAALHSAPHGITITPTGTLYIGDSGNYKIRQLTCVPCPASYYCSSGSPILCPAGSYCPLSSINAPLCPKGTFSNAGAASCTACPAGFFASASGSTSCQQCPGGHFCPSATSSWAHLNCGRGNYCPDGSGAPTPCPYQVPPSGGWGALQVQGPAFLVETALCLNHCFWNFTSSDGLLSKC